jgi:hypothetical protein
MPESIHDPSLILASLRTGRIEPKWHYVTERQAELWREVSQRHSPVHGNPEYARIYREAFARAAAEVPADEVVLVGLGCGTGQKEEALCRELIARGKRVGFVAVDVSQDLVGETTKRLVSAGARMLGSRVADLGEMGELTRWLRPTASDAPRLVTLFGLVPNLPPIVTPLLLRATLREGDAALVSAHLAPVDDGIGVSAAMRSVLPQYDNPETLAWLGEILDIWGIRSQLEAPVMKVHEVGGIPAFVAEAHWKSAEPIELDGEVFTPERGAPLALFLSLRYTPAMFESLLLSSRLRAELLSLTACREEGIWRVKI